MNITRTEIKKMIFQLPQEEIDQLIKEIKEVNANRDFMALAETGFQEWNAPEEDIYNNDTEN